VAAYFGYFGIAGRPSDAGQGCDAPADADVHDILACREAKLVVEERHRLGWPLLSRRVSSIATSTSW